MNDLRERFDLGRYQIAEEIGRGAMGVVYRARQRDLGRDVALKLIHPRLAAAPDAFARFQREARAASRVSDPGLVTVYEAGEHRGQWFLAMELVDGRGLDAVLRDGPIDPRRAAEIVAGVARAVARLHSEGIVHCDLKPANVLIDASGRPRLTDFGLAKLAGDPGAGSTDSAVVGTPAYLAPEQVAARFGAVGPLTDVYGLGAILYELLSGVPPSATSPERGALDAILAVAEREPPSPRTLRPSLPADLERVCLQCLEKRQENRYPTAEAVADDLERFLAGEPTEATPPGPLARIRRWTRRRPALAVRLGGVTAFWAIAIVDYAVLGVSDRGFFLDVTILLGAWAALSLALEEFARRHPGAAAYLWATGDWTVFTLIVLTGDGTESPMIVIYPLLVVVSASWLRERVVAFATVLALASYTALIVVAEIVSTALRTEFDHHLLVYATVLITGILVTAQVGRTRNLMRYAARRRA